MICYSFLGSVDNHDILKYYSDCIIDCFVHVSEHEGLPVSIMEAESAGIPIVATKAGGIEEMIDGNGVLLPVNCSAADVADAVLLVLESPQEIILNKRTESRRIWEERFDAKKNAGLFCDRIERLTGEYNSVVFVTEGYPFIKSEAPFLKSELSELVRRYDHVTIIGRIHRNVTDNMTKGAYEELSECLEDISLRKKISIIPYVDIYNRFETIKNVIRYLSDKMISIERNTIWKYGEKRLIRYWESLKYYTEALKFEKWLNSLEAFKVLDYGKTLIYTFWNLSPTLGLCLFRKDYEGVGIITRAHGFDVQDDRWEMSHRKPFAEVVDELIDHIVFVSKTGKDQYISRYRCVNDDEKYLYSYLGSYDSEDHHDKQSKMDHTVNDNTSGNKVYRIASCGSLIPLKRIGLLIDALRIIKDKRPDINIEWAHFGDGPLRNELETYAACQFEKSR